MDLDDLAKNPEQLKNLITLLQQMLPQTTEENNEEDENENVSQQVQEDEIRPESAPMQFEQKEGIPKLIKINNLIIHKVIYTK